MSNIDHGTMKIHDTEVIYSRHVYNNLDSGDLHLSFHMLEINIYLRSPVVR